MNNLSTNFTLETVGYPYSLKGKDLKEMNKLYNHILTVELNHWKEELKFIERYFTVDNKGVKRDYSRYDNDLKSILDKYVNELNDVEIEENDNLVEELSKLKISIISLMNKRFDNTSHPFLKQLYHDIIYSLSTFPTIISNKEKNDTTSSNSSNSNLTIYYDLSKAYLDHLYTKKINLEEYLTEINDLEIL